MLKNKVDILTKKFAVVFWIFLGTALFFPPFSFCQEEPNSFLQELAFDTREFIQNDPFALSSDGRCLAYSIRKKPVHLNLNYFELPNRTPMDSVGSRLFILHLDQQIEIEIGPEKGDCWRPIWSPDSQKLAFYSNQGGFPQLWIYDVTTRGSKKICDFAIKSLISSVDAVVWSADSHTVYVPLNPVQPEKNVPFASCPLEEVKVLVNKPSQARQQEKLNVFYPGYRSTLVAIDLKTLSMQILVSEEATPSPGFLKLSSSGKWLSYCSVPKTSLHSSKIHYDLTLAQTQQKDSLITLAKDLEVDEIGQGHSWHPRKDKIVWIQNKKLYVAESDTQGIFHTQQLCQQADLEFTSHPLLFTQDGKQVILGAKPSQDHDRETPSYLVKVALEKEQIMTIALNKEWQFSEMIQATENQLIALFKETSTSESILLQVDFQEHDYSSHVLWKGRAKLSHFHPTQQGVLCQYEDLQHPPNIYQFSPDFSELYRISHIDPRLDRLDIPTLVTLDTLLPLYSGEIKKVQTTLLLPKGTKQGDHLPALVFLYPGVEISKSCKFMGEDELMIPNFLFLSQGYALIFADVVIGPEGIAGDPIQEIVNILLPQIYQAASLGYVDIHRLGIAGQSYGGYGVAATISHTSLFRAAVAVSGLYDLGSDYGDCGSDYRFFNSSWCEEGQGRMGHPPWNNWLRYFNNSPYCLADKIHTPFLMIHGEKDDTCNVHEAKKMFTALKRLDREVQLAIYANQGHLIGYWKRSSALDATQRILDFFNHHLKK